MNTKLPELDGHILVSRVAEKESGLVSYIAIHRLRKKAPSFGATRFKYYATEEDALKDALRLSKLMSYKSALAGLPYGGAKAVIIAESKSAVPPKQLLTKYAQRVNLLDGNFITGADMGISRENVAFMAKDSKSFVGIKTDPVYFTVLGIQQSIVACAKAAFGTEDLAHKTIAIQGAGKIGSNLADVLYGKVKKIYITDIDLLPLKLIKKKLQNIEIVKPEEIWKLHVDIFSPCANAHTLTVKTVKQLKCGLVAGGANNQLENNGIGEQLYKQGILYAPDYVINAGGIIAVADEYENNEPSSVRIEERVKNIARTLVKIIEQSKRSHTATNLIADRMAEEIFNSK